MDSQLRVLEVEEVILLGSLIEDVEVDGGDFRGMLLCGIVFRRCRLPRCKFDDSDLSYCHFENCDLYLCSFSSTCLYYTRFDGCDMTRAVLANSFMSGFRLSDVDVTQTDFGLTEEVKLLRNRSSKSLTGVSDIQTFPLGSRINSVALFEQTVAMFTVVGLRNIIVLNSEEHERPENTARRREEIYKYLQRSLSEFGYLKLASRCHYLEHRAHRHTMPRGLRRATDYILGDVVWRYGTDWKPTVVVIGVFIVFFTFAYWLAPWAGFHGGLVNTDTNTIVAFAPNASIVLNLKTLFLAFHYSCVITTLLGAESISATGIARPLELLQVFCSVILLSMMITTISKHLGE